MRAVIASVLAGAIALQAPIVMARTGGDKVPAATPAPAAATGTRVAIAPLAGLVEGGAAIAPLQALVVDGLTGVPGFALIADKELKAALKKSGRKELEACGGDPHCLSELGKLVNATTIVAGEVGELGEGQVAYLKAYDVASEKEIGSTTAVFPADDAGRKTEAKAAAYRLLAPQKYVGTLKLAIDANGAVVYVDGKRMKPDAGGAIGLAVGTHALRVTHEQYKDFVRFVDVKFDQTTSLDVPLTAFPVITDAMHQKAHGPRKVQYVGPIAPLPWYRKWYTVAGGGVVALVATAVIISLTTSPIGSDKTVTVGGP